MILATVNTGRFDWTVAAQSKDQADAALLDAYRIHAEQYNPFDYVDQDLMAELIDDGEVTYVELVVGQVLRDGSPITP